MKKKTPLSALTPLQKNVMFQRGTEPPFQNEYWNNHEKGLYVDRYDGTPLFSSEDKFDSGCGWPSFTKPLDAKVVVENLDLSFGMHRTEVIANDSKVHLGHVFDDGPKALGGLRYCINSASIRFIPFDQLEKEGYGSYRSLFKGKGK